jgi:hypothetical protein
MKALKNILGAAAVAVAFSSCLKDKKIDDQEYGMVNYDKNKIVELAAPPTHVIANAMDYVNQNVTVDLATVNIAADQPASEDVVVTTTLANSNSMIADYNTANGTAVVPLPANFYTLQGSGLTVTVPKGSRMAAVQAVINSINFDPSTTYGLGFTIASVDKQGYTISGSFSKVLVLFSAKNRYDGHYDIVFKMLDWDAAHGISNQVIAWPSAYGIDLVTTGGNTVKMYSPGHGAFIHVAATSALGLTGFGSTEPKFTFDLATNKMTNASNDFPNPSNGRTFNMNPAVTDSRWDPADKTVYAAIIMKQPSRTDLQIFDTLYYVGSR